MTAHVSGSIYAPAGKGALSKTSRTSLAASMSRVSGTHLEDDVTIEIGMTEAGDFEVSLRVGKEQRRRTLSKGNVRRIAAELRRAEQNGAKARES